MNRDVVQVYSRVPLKLYAIQFNGANIELIREFTGGKLSAFHRKNNFFYVNTTEGLMLVKIGDYICRDILGEYSIIGETLFNIEYEIVNDKN